MIWKWIVLQVVLPVIGPIVFAGLVASMFATGPNGFALDLGTILDVTPRALTFYILVLMTSTFSTARVPPAFVWKAAAMVIGGFAAIYHSFTVIWQHDPSYAPNANVYAVTLVLVCASIYVCHEVHRAEIAAPVEVE